ncbi:hypothetical protein [Thiocapsa bogorovii]|uniref:hypothetical protein n=1 Tax=Thiocapsa bogorovii TaxID=521689 RepID=UPI001E5EC6FD|nr:hypothetical protein [Thiocapsa bogorovii]UHD18789.1 hypothetical protein LT988_12450 [Thiocapsa bogorovii]
MTPNFRCRALAAVSFTFLLTSTGVRADSSVRWSGYDAMRLENEAAYAQQQRQQQQLEAEFQRSRTQIFNLTDGEGGADLGAAPARRRVDPAPDPVAPVVDYGGIQGEVPMVPYDENCYMGLLGSVGSCLPSR